MRMERGHPRANLVFGYAIASAATLSLHNPSTIPSDRDDERDGDRVSPPLKKQRLTVKPKETGVTHLRVGNHISDALTIPYFLRLYDLEGKKVEKEEFCRKNLLHVKTMDEMSKFRKQQLELIFHLGGCGEEFSWFYGSAEDVESAWLGLGNQPLLLREEELLG